MSSKRFYIVFAVIATLILVVAVIAIYSSSQTSEDQTQTVDKKGSVETSVSVQHADSAHDVILTSHRVWVHDTTYATLIHRDTIPALDSMYAETENKNGDDKLLEVKKDYQIFITVK